MCYVVWLLQKAVKNGVAVLSPTERMTAVFFAFCLLSSICSIAAIIVGGSNGLADFKDYNWSMHYLYPTFLVPLFGFPLTLSWSRILESGQVSRHVAFSVGVVTVVVPSCFLLGTTFSQRPIHRYTPPLVSFIDDLAAREGLHQGIAGYWHARLVTLLSQKGVRAYAVDSALNPLLWVSNRQWYSDVFKDTPHVDFVILDDPAWHISRESAVRLLGEPIREVKVENTRVLVYKRGPH
jgi:hypothetical protein